MPGRREAIERVALALDVAHRSSGGDVPDLDECRYLASVAIAAYEAHLRADEALGPQGGQLGLAAHGQGARRYRGGP
jgi:hypothetical protein